MPKKRKPAEPPAPHTIEPGVRCLHLALPDGRNFLTSPQNLPVLIEFARTFKVEINLIEIEEEATSYCLNTLIAMICAGSTTANAPRHKVVEVKIKGDLVRMQLRSRREQAAEACAYSRNTLIERGICTVTELMEKYPEIEKTVLSNALNRAVQKMRRENFNVVREKIGYYKVVTSDKEAVAC